MVFFILPFIWLLLAPTKTQHAAAARRTRSRSARFDQLVANWNELFAFQNGVIWTWLGNSAFYSFSALALTLSSASRPATRSR